MNSQHSMLKLSSTSLSPMFENHLNADFGLLTDKCIILYTKELVRGR